MAIRPLGLALKLFSACLEQNQQKEAVTQAVSYKDSELLALKQKEGAVVVILGTRGTGKTELAYRLAEFINKPIFAISPEQAPPPFIKRIALEELDTVPPRSTVIADDLPVYASNRDYNDKLIRMLEKLIPMVRHERKIHLIFCSQSAAQADKYILDCDMAFFKPRGLLTADAERPNIYRIYRNWVDPVFEGKSDYWIVTHAFMLSRRFKGVIEVKKTT